MKVLNFGSVNIDLTYHVDHFVRPGETLAAEDVTRNPGGKGLNQSVALARAGLPVWHAGHIGADGMFLKELCAAEGIRTEFLTEIGTGTGTAVIQVDRSGDNCILLYGGANQAMDLSFITDVLRHFGPEDVIVLQNEVNCMDEILTRAKERGLRIALNPAPMNDRISRDCMGLADWLILNEMEAGDLTGAQEPEAQLECLREMFPETAFVLTLGSRGAIWRKGKETCCIGACRVSAADTTAAGDTFTGFFLGTLLKGSTPETALLEATRASALAVTKAGAIPSIPTLQQVRECDWMPRPFGV